MKNTFSCVRKKKFIYPGQNSFKNTTFSEQKNKKHTELITFF